MRLREKLYANHNLAGLKVKSQLSGRISAIRKIVELAVSRLQFSAVVMGALSKE
jgi:hypothetical protein